MVLTSKCDWWFTRVQINSHKAFFQFFYPLILRLGVYNTINKFFVHHILKLLIIVNMFSFMTDIKYLEIVQNAYKRKELTNVQNF